MKKKELKFTEIEVGTRKINASLTKEMIQDLSALKGFDYDELDRQIEKEFFKKKQMDRTKKLKRIFGDEK